MSDPKEAPQPARSVAALLNETPDQLAHEALQYLGAIGALAEAAGSRTNRDYDMDPADLYWLLMPARDRLEVLLNVLTGELPTPA